jgi:hypothetical protein
MGDVLSDDARLNYRGYVLRRKNRTVVDSEIALKPIDVSYAVLNRNRKRLMKFDANVYFGAGNSTSFGLISILGNPTKQAIISQDVFRGGVQWIVTLSRRPRIIFDGDAWSVGREGDDLGIVDLNGDGVYEIRVPTTVFYGFGNLSPAATPLPTIIFKYSKQAGKYLPANPAFADHLLADVEKRKDAVTPAGNVVDNMNHLADVMEIVLTYIFAGRQREAWAFYDAAYKLPDKSAIKSDIQKALTSHPVYQYLQSHEQRRTAIRKIDFENFAYPAKPIYRRRGFRLKDGGYDGHLLAPAIAPWGPAPISLVAIAYGDVTGDGIEEAMVVLTESVHGTAIPYYLYIYELRRNRPQLLWAVATGDRAEGGLRKAYAENGRLVIELYGDGARVNEKLYGTSRCASCVESFTRTRYRRTKSGFVRHGESEIISLSDQAASMEMEYRQPD